jgi:hypothetical protein
MARRPRLDIPDLVYHVIVRGIKPDKIFRDNDYLAQKQKRHGYHQFVVDSMKMGKRPEDVCNIFSL